MYTTLFCGFYSFNKFITYTVITDTSASVRTILPILLPINSYCISIPIPLHIFGLCDIHALLYSISWPCLLGDNLSGLCICAAYTPDLIDCYTVLVWWWKVYQWSMRHGFHLASITLLWFTGLNIGWDCLICYRLWAHVTSGNFHNFSEDTDSPLHNPNGRQIACR